MPKRARTSRARRYRLATRSLMRQATKYKALEALWEMVMNKAQRKRLITKANEQFARPFLLLNDENKARFFIQSQTDERMFIDFGNSKVNWYARGDGHDKS